MDEAKFRHASLLDLQALRLLRAFVRIGDPKHRQELVLYAEELATSPQDTAPPDGEDR